ncbi:MAG: hypothetical protein Q4D62_07780 [Planctomycetia bacterium]|nr:hypothetical protein [Planctomycetia bacterium]
MKKSAVMAVILKFRMTITLKKLDGGSGALEVAEVERSQAERWSVFQIRTVAGTWSSY